MGEELVLSQQQYMGSDGFAQPHLLIAVRNVKRAVILGQPLLNPDQGVSANITGQEVNILMKDGGVWKSFAEFGSQSDVVAIRAWLKVATDVGDFALVKRLEGFVGRIALEHHNGSGDRGIDL